MFQLCRNQPLEEKVKELEDTLQAKNSEISKLKFLDAEIQDISTRI